MWQRMVNPTQSNELLRQAAASSPDAALQILESTAHGLSSSDAARRLALYGANEVRAESRSLGTIVRSQATNGINLLLAGAGVLTFAIGDAIDGAIIIGLLSMNVGLSIVQEYRAERALEALRSLLPLQAHVWRDDRKRVLPARELVPGDIVEVRHGNVVPADIRVLSAQGLQANQAMLTGESLPQPKDVTPTSDGSPTQWSNVLFGGTAVVGGRGTGVVVATGPRTQLGATAAMLRGTRAPSDFQVNLARFGGFLLRFALLLSLVVFVANSLLGRGIVVSLTLALALALGTVPEALPAITATTLALGAAALARKQVLIRRLAAVEDFSVVDTLCIDKTGTITQNQTLVTGIWSRIDPKQVIEAAVLCTGYPQKDSDVIDDALVQAAISRGIPLDTIAHEPRTTLLPFTSERKRMCVVVDRPAQRELICKGAAGVIVERCGTLRTTEGDTDLKSCQRTVEDAIAAFEDAGARVLAVATRRLPPGTPDAIACQDEAMTLLGLIGLADPPRPDASAALARVAALGLTLKIVTGDALRTARAIAEQVDLHPPADAVVDAEQLRGSRMAIVAERGEIFAGVAPADKYRLVHVLQENGHHVAMTGME